PATLSVPACSVLGSGDRGLGESVRAPGQFCCLLTRRPRRPTLFPYTTLFRSVYAGTYMGTLTRYDHRTAQARDVSVWLNNYTSRDRKSTRLNSSHDQTSYAVFCLKKKSGRGQRLTYATWK